MKLLKRDNKGFTLTELIIVIVIIGILAAVLIPSLTSYVNKAKRSNDVQEAAYMTKELHLYCDENEIDKSSLLGTDVRTILLFKGYSLKPKTKNWTFIYNANSQAVEVVDVAEGALAADWSVDNSIDPTNYQQNMYLVGKGENNIEKGITMLCNCTSADDYKIAGSLLANTGVFQDLYKKYDPKITLYVNNINAYAQKNEESYNDNGQTKTRLVYKNISQIVYLENTVHIPSIDEEMANGLIGSFTNQQSQIIKTIQKDSTISHLFSGVNAVSDEDVNKIEIENEIDMKNLSSKPVVKMGKYVTNSLYQEFKDIIVNVANTGTSEDPEYTITRKFIVSYYNQDGLYARGIRYYTVIE